MTIEIMEQLRIFGHEPDSVSETWVGLSASWVFRGVVVEVMQVAAHDALVPVSVRPYKFAVMLEPLIGVSVSPAEYTGPYIAAAYAEVYLGAIMKNISAAMCVFA